MLNNVAYETQSTVCYSAEVASVDPSLGLYNKHGAGNAQPMLFTLAGPLIPMPRTVIYNVIVAPQIYRQNEVKKKRQRTRCHLRDIWLSIFCMVRLPTHVPLIFTYASMVLPRSPNKTITIAFPGDPTVADDLKKYRINTFCEISPKYSYWWCDMTLHYQDMIFPHKVFRSRSNKTHIDSTTALSSLGAWQTFTKQRFKSNEDAILSMKIVSLKLLTKKTLSNIFHSAKISVSV